jgi:hypothetical protein
MLYLKKKNGFRKVGATSPVRLIIAEKNGNRGQL